MSKVRKLPKIIQDVGFDFHWASEKVWKLDVPVEEVDISELEWHFDIPFWWTKDGYYDLCPNEVLKNSEKHKEEFERIMKSDLSYPLDIIFWKGNWVLLDGLHRLVKAKQLEMRKVKVRKIPKSAISKIRI